jgi:deoxyhypusine synthase
MADPRKPIDPSGVRTVPIKERPSKVLESAFARPISQGMTFKQWLDTLPDILAARDLIEIAGAVVEARANDRPVIIGMGAHAIKVGLSPLLIDMMERNVITAIAMHGAGAVHDFEIAMSGRTSEEVGPALDTGMFGMARETGEDLNSAALRCANEDIGLGRAMGEAVLDSGYPFENMSLLAAAARTDTPATVHVAIGTDIVHMHPGADGAAIGAGSLRDFRILAALVSELEGGVYINLGSAVIMPEVFLKALSLARNLGHKVESFVTVNMDFIQHYRPQANVVERPVRTGGRGYRLTGHHEIMFPLLVAAVIERLEGP